MSSVDLFKRYQYDDTSKTAGRFDEINVNDDTGLTTEEKNYLLNKQLSANYVINYLHYKGYC